MNGRILPVLAVTALYATLSATFSAPVAVASQAARAETGTKQTSETVTLTGVVDQQDGQYVIAGSDRVAPIAVLRSRGFSGDNFARFVGMRVTVKGEMATEGETKILYVRDLADIKQSGGEDTGKAREQEQR